LLVLRPAKQRNWGVTMKIKVLFKKYSKEILLSVVVSVITAGIINGAEWIAEVTPTAGNSVWRFLSNSFFHSAAKMTETSLITCVFALLTGIAISVILVLTNNALGVTKKAISTAENILRDVHNPQPEVDDAGPEITSAEITAEANDIIKKVKRGRILLIVCVVFFAIYFGDILAFGYLPHGLWNDYQRDLLKIAPYVEQQEIDMIKSDWMCMQSKEDYDEIYERINRIKNEYELP